MDEISKGSQYQEKRGNIAANSNAKNLNCDYFSYIPFYTK